ncbi:MAG: heparan-alpha-glucosaminide N-acetyltransferase domain-containing protein [Polyangiales bacterium]
MNKTAKPAPRIEGIDLARGLASLIMIQGHAYDGWVSAAAKQTAAYRFTRLLGTLPLPAFLVLVGAAMALRWEAALRRQEAACQVRRALAWRGVQVLGWGYATNIAYALMDGIDSWQTLLRVDVLQVIALSILLSAAVAPGGQTPLRRAQLRAFAGRLTTLGVGISLLCPWLTAGVHALPRPWHWGLAWAVASEGLTPMPLVPLAAWTVLGLVAALWLRAPKRHGRAQVEQRAGSAHRAWGQLAMTAAAFTAGGLWLYAPLERVSGIALSHRSPAIWANILDLGGRGLLVMVLGAWGLSHLPAPARRALKRLGQGSLVAYVLHIPLCYGRLALNWRGRLDMETATLAVLLLMLGCWTAVWLRDGARRQLSRR